MVPRAQPQTVKKRIAVIDDPTHVDIDDDSDTECDLAVRPIGHPTAAFKEDVPAMQGPQQAEPQSKAELPLRTPSVEWEADSPGELGTPDRLENSLADRMSNRSHCCPKRENNFILHTHDGKMA